MAETKIDHVILGEAGVVPVPENIVQSNPLAGKYRVTNLYVDENGKLVVEWDETPAS